MLSQEHFDKRIDGMVNLLSLIMQDQGDQNKVMQKLRRDVDKNTYDLNHLKTGDRWKLGVVAVLMLALIVWGTITYNKINKDFKKEENIEQHENR